MSSWPFILVCLMALALVCAEETTMTAYPEPTSPPARMIPRGDALAALLANTDGFLSVPVVGPRGEVLEPPQFKSSADRKSEKPPLPGNRFLRCNTEPPAGVVVRDYETQSIYSSVAKLYRYNIVTGQAFDLCSGWWIGNNLLATAAHCVFETSSNNWYLGGNWTIMAVFGLNGPPSPFNCGGMTCPDSYARQGYVDTQYTLAFATQARIFTDYAELPAFSATAGVDVALITLVGTPQGERYCWAEPHFCPRPSANLASSTSRRPITNQEEIHPKDGYYTYEGDTHDHNNIINVHCDCPACPPCPSYPEPHPTCVHKNMGYPAETLPGWDLVFDMSTNEAADVDPRSPDLLREQVNIEGGDSGGPLFASYKDPTVLGIASAIASGCPAYYKSPAVGVPTSQDVSVLTTLDELVKQQGGRVYTSGGHHCVIS